MTSSFWNVQTRAAFRGVEYSPAGYFFAVDGTVYPGAPFPPQPILDNGSGYWCGFSSGMWGGACNIQDGLWAGGCVGYPAVTIPMWPSVQIGRQNLVEAIRMAANDYLHRNGTLTGLVICMSGYSQGAMVTDQVWVLDVLALNGALHDLLPYIYRIYQFGEPFRTPGIAHGNALAGLSEDIKTDGVATGGIGGSLDLTEAQTNYLAPDGKPVVMSCANQGDIYASCPTGLNPWKNLASAGEVGNTFFKIVMQPTFVDVIEVTKLLFHLGGDFEEMINGLKFAAEGTNSPHYQYFPQMDACIGDLLQLGNSLPHQGC